MEQMRERVARIASEICGCATPEQRKRDIALIEAEIDRRVAEEWARLLERLREPSERMLALGRHAAGYRLPTGVVKNVWQALSAQFEKENSDG